jgi:uncharacterized membrane protein
VIVALHLSAAVAALLLGAAVLFLRKGTTLHRLSGRTCAGLMLVTALSSFWITRSGSYSWIHLLSAWVLVALSLAVYFIRRGNVRAHRGFMLGTYLGLVGAGLGALAPGRILHLFFFA